MVRKNVLVGLVTAAMLLGMNGLHVKADFYEEVNDEKSATWDWAENAIRWAQAEGISTGSGDGVWKYFNADSAISRAEAVTMLDKFMELDTAAYEADSTVFDDVNGAWYTAYVNAAYDNGYVSGKASGRFDPNGKLTRAEAATILVKALGYVEQGGTASFEDIADKWYTGYVTTAYTNQLVSGKSAARFDPESNVTRAEFVTMLYNARTKGYQDGEFFAVSISYHDGQDFTLKSNGEVIFSFTADSENGGGTVTGDVTVKTSTPSGIMVYLPPCTELEMDPADLWDGLRFYARNGEVDVASISNFNIEKIVIESDKSVVFYCKDKEKFFLPMLYMRNLDGYTITNEEGLEMRFEKGSDAPSEQNGYLRNEDGTEVYIRNEPSKYYKITPINDTSFKITAEFYFQTAN
ncbi:MAG: S-layer homology domain-containing protein [Lachnospiraceae bacterium]|nr:S-layer homology domain-containing protein [Lachnospiraceae bacterium]